jgi:hypothetical protein
MPDGLMGSIQQLSVPALLPQVFSWNHQAHHDMGNDTISKTHAKNYPVQTLPSTLQLMENPLKARHICFRRQRAAQQSPGSSIFPWVPRLGLIAL